METKVQSITQNGLLQTTPWSLHTFCMFYIFACQINLLHIKIKNQKHNGPKARVAVNGHLLLDLVVKHVIVICTNMKGMIQSQALDIRSFWINWTQITDKQRVLFPSSTSTEKQRITSSLCKASRTCSLHMYSQSKTTWTEFRGDPMTRL
jgi:hypothetical protein